MAENTSQYTEEQVRQYKEKLYRNEEGGGTTETTSFDCLWNSMDT